MDNIGSVIEEYRNKLDISRKELTEGICSEKYLYMIEKGERNPSTELTRRLGNRMGVDLFEYYGYLDCKDPIGVKNVMKMFNKYRMENDINSLTEATLEAMNLPDFQKAPWMYAIEYNKYHIKILGNGEVLDSINKLPSTISEMNQNNASVLCIANFYVLLSTCYHMTKDIKNAKKAIICADELIRGKDKITKYLQVIITVKICKMSADYLAGELDSVIEEGINLNKYENEASFYERSHYILFFLAFAYYQKGLQEIGIEQFIKALCISLIKFKPIDIYYLRKFEIFEVIIEDQRVPKDLVNLFKVKYSIT